LKQLGQRAGQRGRQARHLVEGLDAGKGTGLAAGITQQHALQAELRRVAVAAGRQPQLRAVRAVQAPADAGALHPGRQQRQVGAVHAQAARHRGHVQQRLQFAQAGTRRRRAQQPFQRHQQRLLAPFALVGDAPGDVARVTPRAGAEDAADGGRKGLDVGHHHHDVARLQRRRCGVGQQLQQLVVQHLHLALGAVGDVEDDAVVGVGQRAARLFGGRQQVAHAGLHLLQQRALPGRLLVEQVHARRAQLLAQGAAVFPGVELAHEVTGLAAPGRQQRVAVGVHVLQRHGGQVAATAQRLAALLQAQQLAAGDGVGPVEAAGVGHRHQHLAARGQRGDGLQRGLRHVRGAEQHHAARQATRRPARGQRLHKALMQLRPRGGAFVARQFGLQRAPQRRLPLLVIGHRCGSAAGTRQPVVAVFPGLQPVGPVDLVLVEEVGQALRQLQPARAVVTRAQEASHRREHRVGGQLRQQAHQPPGERQLVQRRPRRHRATAQHGAVGAPDEARRQLHAGGGAGTVGGGQFHLHPLGHAVAGHQDQLFFQRRQRFAAQPFEDGRAQQFKPVAVQDEQAGFDGGSLVQQGSWRR
jgi:hypothetical protein